MDAEIQQDWVGLRYVGGFIVNYHDHGAHALSPECANNLREALQRTDRRNAERRRTVDRRDPDAYRDLVDEPL